MSNSGLEDMCGAEFDRGLGRVWVCSLPSDDHDKHLAYPWHNMADYEALAEWRGSELLGYRSQATDEWMEL